MDPDEGTDPSPRPSPSELSITQNSGWHFGQSQRDCALQPRVASVRATLGSRANCLSTPTGLWLRSGTHGHNPVGVGLPKATNPGLLVPCNPGLCCGIPSGFAKLLTRDVGNDKPSEGEREKPRQSFCNRLFMGSSYRIRLVRAKSINSSPRPLSTALRAQRLKPTA